MNPYRFLSQTAVVIVLMFTVSFSYGQTSFPEFSRTSLIAETDDARAVFINPAGLMLNRRSNSFLQATFSEDNWKHTAFAWQNPFLSVGFTSTDLRTENDHQKSFVLASSLENGTKRFGFGASWRWIWGPGKDNSVYDLGVMFRPARFASLGGVIRNVNEPTVGIEKFAREWVGGVSLRPPGSNRLTVSYQAIYNDISEETDHLVGARINVTKGIQLFGSYFSQDEDFSIGLQINLPRFGLSHSVRTKDQEFGSNALQSVSLSSGLEFKKNALTPFSTIVEIPISGSYEDFSNGFVLFGQRTRSAIRLTHRLSSAANDADISGVVLKIGPLSPGFIGEVSAIHQEIRAAILEVKNAGKPVVAFVEGYPSAGEMYLASAADHIVMHETAFVSGIGVGLELDRLKGLFEKFGIDWEVVTAGDYKGAFHTMYTDSANTVQKENIEALVKAAYDEMVETIFDSRAIPLDQKEDIAHGGIILAKEAVSLKLVDAVGYYEDAVKWVSAKTGRQDAKPSRLRYRKYWLDDWTPAPVVAVVTASGSIEEGESHKNYLFGGRVMGSATVVRQLRRAANQPGVRALVFRIDSGGGSPVASDIILNEISRIRKEKNIPIIVSMADVAGSGGYWVSLESDAIVANPLTITGSIGVIGAKPVFETLYDSLRIHHEVFKAGRYSDMFSTARHALQEERAMAEAAAGQLYELFLSRVSEKRNLPKSDVESAAGGKLFLGRAAKDARLIDVLGGLAESIALAAEKAGIAENYRVLTVRADQTGWPDRLTDNTAVKTFLKIFGDNETTVIEER